MSGESTRDREELREPPTGNEGQALLLDRIHQRRHPLDPDLEAVSRLDRADPARGPGQDDITREEGHVRRDETDQLIAIEDQLTRQRVLAELTVLKKLNGQLVRVDFGLHIRAQRSEGIK